MSSSENLVPELRIWESGDFTVSKTVLEEGEIELDEEIWTPRFGSTGMAELDQDWTLDGDVDEEELTSNPTLSRMLHCSKSLQPTVINFRVGFADTDVDRTFDDAIKSMFLNERSSFTLRIKLNSKLNNLNLKGDTVWIRMTCILTLKTLKNSAQIFKWPAEQKLKAAKELKNSGVELFGQKRFFDSFLAFRQSLTLVSFALEETPKTADENEADDLKFKCATNLVGCHLQLSNFPHVVSLASDILSNKNSPKNVKLLYRRGIANLELKNYELAIHDLMEALELDPGNKVVGNGLNQARMKNKESNQKLSEGLKKMFS